VTQVELETQASFALRNSEPYKYCHTIFSSYQIAEIKCCFCSENSAIVCGIVIHVNTVALLPKAEYTLAVS
jgi:hypothetical protein